MTYTDACPIAIGHLFDDPNMFDSSRAFSKAGFDLVDRTSTDGIMVASHDDVPGYFFKKYRSDRRLDKQLKNYQLRIAGARAMYAHIADQQLRHVVVPRKWLHKLPAAFAQERKGKLLAAHVLVVERFQLLDKHDVEDAYRDIDEDVLRDLCAAVARFPGLDSTPKNVPFTEDGRVAFIDTESWDSHEGREPFKYIRNYLSMKRWRQAREIFEELGRG